METPLTPVGLALQIRVLKQILSFISIARVPVAYALELRSWT